MHYPQEYLFEIAASKNIFTVGLSIVGDANYFSDLLINQLATEKPDHSNCMVINDDSSHIYDVLRFSKQTPPSLIAEYIYIALGGSYNLYEAYKNIIQAVCIHQKLTSIIFIKDHDTLTKLVEEYSALKNIKFVSTNHSQYLAYAKYVISGFGTTLWESLGLGKPCHVIAVNEQQFQHSMKIKNNDFMVCNFNDRECLKHVNTWINNIECSEFSYIELKRRLQEKYGSENIIKLAHRIIAQFNQRYQNVSRQAL